VEIVSLSTEGFRNLLNGRVELHPRLNLLVGDNGQGKTNLLEALALVSGRSSFRAREQDRDGKRGTRLTAARSLPAGFLTARDLSRLSGPPAERRAVAVGGAGPR
jgi:predicted ATPase